jgi:hypothetical protein
MPEFDLAKETRCIEIFEPEMTKELFTLFVLLAVPLTGLASISPTTTDNQVIAGGGYSIDDKTFGSWSFSSSASGGATLVQASTVAYKPLPTSNNPVTVVDVIKDLDLTGGTKGTAVVTAVENQFSEATVPESGTLALVGIGAICLGRFLRQRLSSNS